MTHKELKCLLFGTLMPFIIFLAIMACVACCHKEAIEAPKPAPVVIEGDIEVNVAGYVVKCKKLTIHE